MRDTVLTMGVVMGTALITMATEGVQITVVVVLIMMIVTTGVGGVPTIVTDVTAAEVAIVINLHLVILTDMFCNSCFAVHHAH